jgi:hypothetical protein
VAYERSCALSASAISLRDPSVTDVLEDFEMLRVGYCVMLRMGFQILPPCHSHIYRSQPLPPYRSIPLSPSNALFVLLLSFSYHCSVPHVQQRSSECPRKKSIGDVVVGNMYVQVKNQAIRRICTKLFQNRADPDQTQRMFPSFSNPSIMINATLMPPSLCI